MTARLLFILYCLEAALFLVLVPWTSFWTDAVAVALPSASGLLRNEFVRGLVSGIGLIHLFVGARDGFLLATRGLAEPGPGTEESSR